MDVEEALRRNRPTAWFEPDGITLSREMIEELIAGACQAPSDFDLQPWRFVVVRDQERKEILHQCAYRQVIVREAAAVLIVCGDTRGHDRVAEIVAEKVEQGLVPAADAPRVEEGVRSAYEVSDRNRLLLAARGAAAAATALVLLATGWGIATTPMVTFSEDAVRRAFHLPDRFLPVFLVALGMPSTSRPQPVRAARCPVARVVWHEDGPG
jgi:nitroreductase